jgi:phage-related protein
MVPSRVLAGIGALACAAGVTSAAITPASAARVDAGAAAKAAEPGAAAAAAERGKLLPPHVFAPYYSNGSDTLAATSRASGAKYLTLAFLQTARPGSCTVVWNGDPKTGVGKTYAAGIAAVQRAGGNVVPSFGGASADSADEEIADSCHSVSKIAGQYEKVITTYHVTRLDLDTEEDSLNNYAGINRRNEAIAMVERWAARTHRTVQFVYTIPTNATGIDQGGSVVLQNAVANKAKIAIVDIMTFDYYDNLPHEMADNTEGAAQQLFDRLHELYPGKSASQLWGMIGICEDLGVDDYGPAETFTLGDARTVERWAASKGLAELSFWNVQDDNSAGSQQKQSRYEYSHILEPFTSWTPIPGGTAPGLGAAPQPGPDHQSGNFRSVSCPTATFCMAVDESGNNALAWNGTSWSRPVTIDPDGDRVELTSVSCATPAFCAAVDTLGRAITWNGQRWSAPDEVDPHGAGLESVSCPTASFCEAVDGNGNGLTWTGNSWTRPVPIDDTGTGIQSVSCASASFCAAGDWGGHVVTWNGAHWSKPKLVDPTTPTAGGGIGSLSCPTETFCVGVDWNGGSVTYNGKAWKLDKTFDPNGAEGLMEVSCTTASFCMAVDGGDDLIWNGHAWTSPDLIDVTGDGIESVSCGSTSSCMVVDWDGNALHWNGASWPATAISCPDQTTKSAGDCTTTGSYADPRTGVLDSVSCPTASFCAAVDGNGNALTTAGPIRPGARPAGPVNIDPIAGILSSVSCPSASFCMAVDTNGYALSWNGTAWSQPTWSATSPADRAGGALTSVSCPATTFCVATDGNGRVLTWHGSSWSAPLSVDAGGGGLTAVSCPSVSFCAAVDADGRAVTWHGSSWSAPSQADRHGRGLTAVSCASASFCAAVDARGRVIRWNGTAWSAPRQVDPAGGLTAVSCPTTSWCAAVDQAGLAIPIAASAHVVAYLDPDGGGLTAVSCLASRYCVATDFDGRMVSFRLPIRH